MRRVLKIVSTTAYAALVLGLVIGLRPTGERMPKGRLLTWVSADPERALVLAATGLGWLLAVWLLTVTVLAAAARSRGCIGLYASRLFRWLTPRAMRGVVEASISAALTLGPAGGVLASPAPIPTPPPATAISASALPPVPAPIVAPPEPAIPSLDRPLAAPAQLPPPRLNRAPAISRPAPVHAVVSGDNLWSLASAQLPPGASPAEITRAWQRWYAVNRMIIGPDPALLLPGEVLTMPAVAA